jgi:site-specific DNA recombinase
MQADIIGKREIVSSMFPEKIVFDGKEHRTPRVNEVAFHIYQISNALALKKDGTSRNNLRLSHMVALKGNSLNTY